MEKAKRARAKFYVDKKSKLVHDSVLFMTLAMVFLLIGCWGTWNDRFYSVTQVLLPLLAAGLFIVCLRFLGEKALWTSCLPAAMGALFFVFRGLGFSNWVETALSIGCAVLAAVVYIATVLGFIRSKWFLPPLFALPFLYHVAIVDVAALRSTTDQVLFSEGMLELSVLSMMLSLFFCSLAMKRRIGIDDMNLPKIKDPVVIAPKPQTPAAAPVAGTDSRPAPSDNQAPRIAAMDAPAAGSSKSAENSENADAPKEKETDKI